MRVQTSNQMIRDGRLWLMRRAERHYNLLLEENSKVYRRVLADPPLTVRDHLEKHVLSPPHTFDPFQNSRIKWRPRVSSRRSSTSHKNVSSLWKTMLPTPRISMMSCTGGTPRGRRACRPPPPMNSQRGLEHAPSRPPSPTVNPPKVGPLA